MLTKYVKFFLIILFIAIISLSIQTNTYADTEGIPVLTSDAAVLMDAKTGQVIYEKNMHSPHYPASITKVMTGLLALERGKLSDILQMSREAVFSIEWNSSHIALDVEEEITLEQALNALAVASANDAANGIAEYIAGDLESFAELMTKRAAELGARNTNFTNAHGLPDENHYTTAYDMARIMMQAVKNNQFLKVFNKYRYELPPTNIQPETRYLNNTNPLLNGKYKYDGIIASKKGWTSDARHTLVSAAQRGDRELIVVVMNNKSANEVSNDTIKLFDYGFNEFSEVIIHIDEEVNGQIADLPELDIKENEEFKLNSQGKITRLLHKSLSADDVVCSTAFVNNHNGEATLKLSVQLKQDNRYMYKNLEGPLLTLTVQPAVEKIKRNSFFGSLRYLLVPAVMIALLRMRVYIRRRRRKMQYLQRAYRYRDY